MGIFFMDELIDIVTETGDPTGKVALKSEAHKNGWYHNTIHVWFYTKDKKVLLQQRSHKKKIFPLLWDVSVAGHIDAGEPLIEAALREAKEEIGLQLQKKDLKKIGVKLHKSEYDSGKIKDYEFHHVYIAELKTPLEELKPQEDEVEALKLVTFESFLHLLDHSHENNHFIASNDGYYRFVMDEIKKETK